MTTTTSTSPVPDRFTFAGCRDVGPLVRNARKDAGLTADVLAARVGVTRSAVNMYRTPDLTMPVRLLDVLGYDLQAVKR